MKSTRIFLIHVVLFFLLAPLVNTNHADLTFKQAEPIELITPPRFKINSTIPINVVFIGFDESNIDVNQIDSDILHWNAPSITVSQQYYPYFGTNYTLDINYYFSNSTTLENDYVSYLNTIFTTTTTLPASLTDYDAGATQALLIPADQAITWLDNNINSYFAQVNSSYTFYLIDTYTWGYIFDYYFYTLDYIDPDTGQLTLNPYTILYGGDYPNRGIFMDLSAGPVNYNEGDITEANEGVSAITIPPIWEYNLPSDAVKLNTNITEYIQETIELVFTPSYLYDPAVREDLDIKIVLFDDATVSQFDQIDISTIEQSFSFLYPSSNVTVSGFSTTLSNYPDLATEMTNAIDPSDSTSIIGQPVVDYLLANLATFGMDENTIPVFIWAWDDDLWFGGVGTLGYAADDGNHNPVMTVMGYNPTMGNPNEGYTITIIHEIGHMVGFRHPHDGVSLNNFFEGGSIEVVDWLRDFISTPMGYAQVDATFSTFDIDNMDRAYTYERINDSWWNLLDANYTLLVDKGYSDLTQSGISTTLLTSLAWVLANKTMSLQSFENEDFFDAFYYANLSSYASERYYFEVFAISDYVPPPSITSTPLTTTTTETTTSTDTTSTSITDTTSVSTTTSTQSSTPIDTTPEDTNGATTPISNIVILAGISILIIRRKWFSTQ